ncbi:hypothetical protein V500_06414 [Pseudogymnoascus sp. VKM F-4518 (FW-2643)]|nr:hypothetical protein V500_06414 [Pseudogymnoascus sp. VKM F-4518 (FW-2643)]
MRRDHKKLVFAIALASFITKVQSFEDLFTHGVITVQVGAGTYSLLVDTGSSNTWVGSGAPYQPGPNSQDTGETVYVSYGDASFSGEEFTDDVTLDSLTIQGQSIGVATSSTGMRDLDGVLGLGPTGLTQGTTSGGGEIPTVIDNLFSQGTIAAHLVSIAGKQISYGKTDASTFVGAITYGPITGTSPANTFWGIDGSFTYGPSGTSILATTAGIIDHSSTRTLLASDAYSTFLKLTGATTDQKTSFAVLDSCDKLESISFDFGGAIFQIPVEQYRWPADQNTVIGGDVNKCYLAVGDLGTKSGHGLDFILGYNTLKHFTVILDTGNSRVGIAKGNASLL